MTEHDKGVLQVSRSLLKKGANEISVGSKVKSYRKIAGILRKEFPNKKIKTHK